MINRVVITGMGALTPIGNNVNDFWLNCLKGTSGAETISTFDVSTFKTKFACTLKAYDANQYFNRKEINKYDLFTQYALVSVEEAISQSKLDIEKLNLDRVGVIWGSGNGGIQSFEDQMKEYYGGDQTARFSPFFIPRILVDIAAGVISLKYGFRGVNFAAVSACASATTAIIDAFNHIKWGKADVIVCGGSEAAITPATIGGFGAAKALSTRNDEPERASRPFDIDRDGFVMGEGAGALILESYEHAKSRGANILGEVVGGGMAADAYHLTGTHPEGRGAVLGMQLAIEEAGISPDEIGHINMHATSTGQGDLSELKAVNTVFGKRSDLYISATKSMTGHLLGAAGAIESIIAVKSLVESTIPPTINLENMEPEFEGVFNVPNHAKNLERLDYAMSNTFGFGGHIASVLFKRFKD